MSDKQLKSRVSERGWTIHQWDHRASDEEVGEWASQYNWDGELYHSGPDCAPPYRFLWVDGIFYEIIERED